MDLKGKYECTLDDKGRIILPSVLRKLMPNEVNEEFTVNRGFDGCLVLYPKPRWEEIRNDLRQLSEYIEEEREYKRSYLEFATPAVLDSMGRFLLTQKLLDWAGLKKDVVLVGVGEHIEIWSKQAFDSRDKLTPQRFSEMAAKLGNRLRPNDSGHVS